jgi:hypothetical protein
MLIILLLIVAGVLGAAALPGYDGTAAVMDAYCRLECKGKKIQDYSVCC